MQLQHESCVRTSIEGNGLLSLCSIRAGLVVQVIFPPLSLMMKKLYKKIILYRESRRLSDTCSSFTSIIELPPRFAMVRDRA